LIRTSTCDNLAGQTLLGFQIEVIDKLSKQLKNKSTNGVIEIEIITSMMLAKEILVPMLRGERHSKTGEC
jgi:hypothetical protein